MGNQMQSETKATDQATGALLAIPNRDENIRDGVPAEKPACKSVYFITRNDHCFVC